MFLLYKSLYLLLFICHLHSILGINVFVSENGEFFVCHNRTGTLFRIPDAETTKKVFESMRVSSVPKLNSKILSDCALASSSLIHRDHSRDETTRVKVQLAKLISPSSFIVLIKKLQGFYLNPSIAFTSNYQGEKVLMSWRKVPHAKAVLSFGWLNMKTMEVQVSSHRPDNYLMGAILTSQEDARLLVTNDRKIITVYTGNYGSRIKTKMFCSIGTWNSSSLELSFENSYYLRYEGNDHQKNWIPFLYNNSLLFIQTLVPLTTLSIAQRDENYVATMKVFSVNHMQNRSSYLPWKADEYGAY
jgi:hypothetical protein